MSSTRKTNKKYCEADEDAMARSPEAHVWLLLASKCLQAESWRLDSQLFTSSLKKLHADWRPHLRLSEGGALYRVHYSGNRGYVAKQPE
ncbi:hypothetical protein B5X24_HaOG209930 [Helicoverpa armigera]|uniref:Uncharacterized protein n=1 Tax=Helicoverpa armigera TaxID=29058 RepID=A0A2W1BED0_HELAM|nr:hypothetical protein B5X24_HaOG209930 [Helicoverpa armigera]